MSGCRLLARKSSKEAKAICLNCPLPECNPGRAPRCQKCGGNLFLDREEDGALTWHCLQCGAVIEPAAKKLLSKGRSLPSKNLKKPKITGAGTADIRSVEEVPAMPVAPLESPAPAEEKPDAPSLAPLVGPIKPKPKKMRPQGIYQLIKKIQAIPEKQSTPVGGRPRKFVWDGTWFAPREIQFTPEHMIFLIVHLDLLREGRYPPDPRASGYTETRTGGLKSRQAYFTQPAELAAEVDSRLARCGLYRYLIEDRYANGISEAELAQKVGLSVRTVYLHINSMMRYISGWHRKKTAYRDYHTQRIYKSHSSLISE